MKGGVASLTNHSAIYNVYFELYRGCYQRHVVDKYCGFPIETALIMSVSTEIFISAKYILKLHNYS